MIECQKVKKVYNLGTSKEVVALEEATFYIPKGSFTLLVGPSGSGKSTLLALIGALTRPTSGKVVVDGEIVSKLPEDFASLYRREKVGFIFQKFHLLEELSVLENVVIPLIPTSSPTIYKKAQEVLKRFSIDHKAKSKVRKLSGGEQQRVAIARSLINDPKLLLADEPTANLDKRLTLEFIEILKELKGEGKTILLATHDPRFLELDFIDKILEVKEGYVIS
ncbi:MAG: ABC transporter ATP-binding protein [Epsilonproteobacteria bacterium]|nr:ABC transporter ATP-binding protein [Campylobacterota bacterium]